TSHLRQRRARGFPDAVARNTGREIVRRVVADGALRHHACNVCSHRAMDFVHNRVIAREQHHRHPEVTCNGRVEQRLAGVAPVQANVIEAPRRNGVRAHRLWRIDRGVITDKNGRVEAAVHAFHHLQRTRPGADQARRRIQLLRQQREPVAVRVGYGNRCRPRGQRPFDGRVHLARHEPAEALVFKALRPGPKLRRVHHAGNAFHVGRDEHAKLFRWRLRRPGKGPAHHEQQENKYTPRSHQGGECTASGVAVVSYAVPYSGRDVACCVSGGRALCRVARPSGSVIPSERGKQRGTSTSRGILDFRSLEKCVLETWRSEAMFLSRRSVLFAICLTLVSAAAAQPKRFITEKDLFDFTWIGDPQMSPDGKRVAFVRVTVNDKKDDYDTSIWTVSTDTGELQRLTSGSRDEAPRWSPDGKRLAFVRSVEQEGKRQPGQIFVLPLSGGEALQVTKLPKGAQSPVWSPDGTKLAFTSRTNAEDLKREECKGKKEAERIKDPKCAPLEHESDVRVIT